MRKKMGECLIQAGLISADDLEHALVEHKRTRERLGVVLVRMNFATEKQIAVALAMQLGFPYVSLAENPPDPSAVILVPQGVAQKRVCIAVSLEKNLLTVAMSDPLLFSLVQDLEFQRGVPRAVQRSAARRIRSRPRRGRRTFGRAFTAAGPCIYQGACESRSARA